MTTVFILVCGVSVIFFLVFFWQCGKPRRPAKTYGHDFSRSEVVRADSMVARRALAHLESQMAEFLTSRQSNSLVLLLVLWLALGAGLVGEALCKISSL